LRLPGSLSLLLPGAVRPPPTTLLYCVGCTTGVVIVACHLAVLVIFRQYKGSFENKSLTSGTLYTGFWSFLF
jgi:hypothetical protein